MERGGGEGRGKKLWSKAVKVEGILSFHSLNYEGNMVREERPCHQEKEIPNKGGQHPRRRKKVLGKKAKNLEHGQQARE